MRVFRYTFQPGGFIINALSIISVLLGVLAAVMMPIHAAFLYRDPIVWAVVYVLDFLHAIFMCAIAVYYAGLAQCK